MTGDSLSIADFEKLKYEKTFSTGFIFLHQDLEKLNLKYYLAVEDPLKNFPDLNWPSHIIPSKVPNNGYTFYKLVNDKIYSKGTKIFLRYEDKNYFISRKLFTGYGEKYYLKFMSNLFYKKYLQSEITLTKRFSTFGGSIFLILQILIYMGFKEIYLLGAGYTYYPTYELHFYDSYFLPNYITRDQAKLEGERIVTEHNKRLGDNLKLFDFYDDGKYYRYRMVKFLNLENENYRKHQMMKDIAEYNGAEIINIIPEGFKSPIYKNIYWSDLIGKDQM